MAEIGTVPADLQDTSPEVKRYERQKLFASVASLVVSLVYLTVAALWLGPILNRSLEGWIGENRWLRLVLLAFVYAVGLEILTLPFDFWSGFVLEHRYQLSNQTAGRWVWRR